MKYKSISASGIVLALALVVALNAERVLTPEAREAESTHIITGKVAAIYSRDVETVLHGKGTIETHYIVEIDVDTVEKELAGIPTIDLRALLCVCCWRVKKRGADGEIDGPGGHLLPNQGDKVRAFLHLGPYGEGNGYNGVYPTGLEIMEKARK